MALFKNKDFSAKSFSDRVIINPDLFGCEGLETFAEADQGMVFSGLSLGANDHGLMATVNHVKITNPAHHNYDRLTELALKDAATIDQAIDAIEGALNQQPFWWGNLIIADPSGCAAIEVRGQTCRISRHQDSIFRVNHQPCFGETASPDDLPCSAKRSVAASHHLPQVRSLQDLKEMLSAHDDGDTGICNHGVPLSTVYSYILVWRGGEITLHVAHGLPCQAPWVELTPPLGSRWTDHQSQQFCQAYPGLDGSSQ